MKKEEFELKKVKVLNEKVEASYQKRSETKTYNVCCKELYHPDLKDSLNQFQVVFEKIFNFSPENVTITGVIMGGKEELENFIITAKYFTENGVVAINTPKISVTGLTWDFETNLKIWFNNVKDEVYQYLFNDKKGQTTLFEEEEE